MLQTIRDRAQGILAWIILILITVPFALWGIGNYFDTGREKPIATVGKREFFERDLLRLYEQQYARLLGQDSYSEKELKQQALNQLIDEELLLQAAIAKNLVVSDSQVAQFIRSLPFLQTDGRFDEAKYQRFLAAEGLSADQFIAQVQRSLLLNQLAQAVVDSSFVSEREAETFYKLQNQRRKIEYLILPFPELEKIPVSNEEIQAYYDQHQDRFKTQEQVAVEYLILSRDTLAQSIEPTEEELRRYYAEQQQAFTTPEQRHLRHILVAVAQNASAEEKSQALAKAQEIKKRLEQGEDFAELAKQFSDDPGSKAQGGDLGFVTKGFLEKNFEEAAFALPKGEISEPVLTPFGYHLIQVVEIKPATPQPFAAVKAQIRQELQRQEAEARLYELAEKLAQLVYENPHSLEPAASALGLTIQSTGLFTRDKGEGVAADPKVRAAAFSEEVLAGNNSEPIETGDGALVALRIRQHLPAQQRPLAEVSTEIAALLRKQKARQIAEIQAKEWLAKLKSGTKLEEIAKQVKATVKTAELSRNAPIAELETSTEAIFQAPRPQADKPVPLRIPLTDDRQVLCQILTVSDGDYSGLPAEEKQRFKANLAHLFGLMTFKEYLAQLRAKAKVKINWPLAESE
ncbi:peptidylprolyl isomerase [Methylothermus subterraneus]